MLVSGSFVWVTSESNPSSVVSCYRHRDRRAGVICQRCDRPICAECMKAASVGFHCPECIATKSQRVIFGPLAFAPKLTAILVGFNVAIWLVAWLSNNSIFNDYALWGPIVADGEWYRIVTSGFLHDGVFHLGFNCFALWILGRSLEQGLGRGRFVTLYFVSILGGSLGVLLLEPNVPVVGASGGIFGLFGAIAIVQRSMGVSIWASGLGPMLALNLALTFAVPRISVGGHIGGLIAGGLVGLIYVWMKKVNAADSLAVAVAAGFGAVLFVVSLLLAANSIF